ncbi:DUF1194 domain-containing protein [Labrenzia sp. VG12]|uniref:DUF1194 domain-containing protein n=1 Tax=Labrenzia sp. VG12 TaxID=2021862 RepID=UPI000B8C11A8|nr:DUF1194 domain-containing protein [Labrenzia sp. VG12]ASP33996.1 hypothetical protein CHH27_12720 [Labrenzia sp. VG12]
MVSVSKGLPATLRRSRCVQCVGWLLAAIVVPWLLCVPASACSLALVVAVDVSASISESEYDLQQRGIAGALRDPSVLEAIETVGGIWLHSFEWSGRYQQNTLLDWRFLSDEASAHAAADEILSNTRDSREFLTALGPALVHARGILNTAPQRCDRQVIDVSADGINNQGEEPRFVYATLDFSEVTVNALVILKDDMTLNYYTDKVITGPGAFIQSTLRYEDYTEAMTRKLIREILGYGFAELR